jgi:hypothetical protein
VSEPGFFRRHLGLDWFDLALHGGLTVCVLVFLGVSDAPRELFPVGVGASLGLLGLRRHRALKRRPAIGVTSGEMTAMRLEEVEQRLGDLEAAQSRIAELEERLDFTERLLARQTDDRKFIQQGEPQ